MKNITLAVEESVLETVRIYAAKQKTTINGLVRDYLKSLASDEERLADTRAQLKQLMDNSTGRMAPDYVWNREELYEERMFPRHKHTDLRSDGETK